VKFTIVTPSYNKGKYIEHTICSVLKQQQSTIDLKYLVIDNSSTDETNSILESYANSDSALKIIRKRDNGQFDAINQGWLQEKGDILGWLNADDIYLDNALVTVANFFYANPTVMAIYGEAIYINSNGQKIKPVTNIRNYSRKLLLSHDFITQPTVFIRREVFDQIGPLSSRYRYIFDWEYWIRISQVYDFVRIPDLIAGYRITGDNLTTTGKYKRLREMFDLTWRYGGLINLLRFLSRLLKKYSLEGAEIPKIKQDDM
jgi:glycosyltransferase involved in cell wall biosynthesis